MKDLLKDQEGAVLVLVLIVLVAAIIMGVMTIRTSIQESKMVVNERAYITRFADLESAVDVIMAQCAPSLAAVSTSIGASFTTVSDPAGPSSPANRLPLNTSVTVTLKDIGPPTPSIGMGVNFQARYYMFQATDTSNNQVLTEGAYRVFPAAP